MTTEKMWKERWRRQEAAVVKVRAATTDDEIIEAVAEYLIAHGALHHPHKWHLSILNMSEERPVSFDWKYKNARGISTTDEARARAWVRECMGQGYGVSSLYAKKGSGGSLGSLAYIRQQRALSLPANEGGGAPDRG